MKGLFFLATVTLAALAVLDALPLASRALMLAGLRLRRGALFE